MVSVSMMVIFVFVVAGSVIVSNAIAEVEHRNHRLGLVYCLQSHLYAGEGFDSCSRADLSVVDRFALEVGRLGSDELGVGTEGMRVAEEQY
jgi:hypothetical protein